MAAKLRRLHFRQHARMRMRVGALGVLQGGRNVTMADLEAAIESATVATHQVEESEQRWRLAGGTDLDGDPLEIVVVVEHDVVVVTVIEGK